MLKILIATIVTLSIITACGRDDGNVQDPTPTPNNSIGNDVSDAVGDAEKGMGDAINGAGNAVKSVGDGVGNAINDVGNASRNMGNTMKNTK